MCAASSVLTCVSVRVKTTTTTTATVTATMAATAAQAAAETAADSRDLEALLASPAVLAQVAAHAERAVVAADETREREKEDQISM